MPEPILYQPLPNDLISTGVYRTPIDGLYYLPRDAHKDERGFYSELARFPEIEAVINRPFVVQQLNLSASKKNVARGFHAENWDKLLTVIEGRCFCAWADFRPQSPTFGQVVTMWVGRGDDAYFGSMFVSKGIGNSFCVVEEPLYYLYAVNQLYAQRDTSGDVAISLFDADLNIHWPVPAEQMIISERDRQATTLRVKFPDKFF